jgi:hypothetical protein
MSSAEDVESGIEAGQDERLIRAFDRVARLGIDFNPDDPLSERESAAVKAFTALNLDAAGDNPAPVTDPGVVGPAAPIAAPGAYPGIDVPAPASASADWSWPSAPHEGPAQATPQAQAPPDAPPRGHALRPDAVLLHGRPLPRDDGPARAPSSDEFDVAPGTTRRERPVATAASGGSTGEATPTAASEADPSPRVDHYLLDLVAAAIATGAFVSPWAWLLVVSAGTLAGTTAMSLAHHGLRPGALARRALRRAAAWLRPRSMAWFTIIGVRTALLAVMVPGVVCAVWWIVDQGTDGAFVAGRLGVWAHGLRVAVAAVCFMLVAGVGEARHRRAAHLRRRAAQAGRRRVAAMVAIMVVGAAGVVTLVPRADAGLLAGDAGLGWAPARLRDNLDRLSDDVVAAELHAAGGCLSDRQGVTWRSTYTAANPLGADDVARLFVHDGLPSPDEVATAAAAIHNQLAPWVESIEVQLADETLVALDRRALPAGRPAVEAGDLRAGTTTGGALLVEGGPGFDRATALACAAAPIP